MNGEQTLERITAINGEKKITKVNDRVYHFAGYGSSNATAIIGSHSVILIDAFAKPVYARQAMAELRKITDKPVRTIIFTHSHIDHTGGAAAFADSVEEIIAFTPVGQSLPYYDKIAAGLGKRALRQFGALLTPEEGLSMGLGYMEAPETAKEAPEPLAATTVYEKEEKVFRIIDGVAFDLCRAPGETDDQIYVWMPEDRVVCSGDNYYACWPNLYAIRGTNYRDIATWVESLGRILSNDAAALLPGHSAALLGREVIQDQVGTYRDAIQYVLMETLDCINQGMTMDETVEHVKLPDQWRDKDYLQETYGTVEWSVKGIYSGYIGWFDGDPIKLMPLPEKEYAAELAALIGKDKLHKRAAEAVKEEKYQLALQLLALDDDPALRRQALIGRARQMVSANARHYLYSCAKEIK